METKAERLAYVNEHRDATGHPRLDDSTTIDELERHERLIGENAPFGNDPWS